MAPPHWYVYVEIRRLPVSLASDLCGEPRNCVGNSFADFRKILDGAWSLRLRQYQLRLHAIRFDGGDLTREMMNQPRNIMPANASTFVSVLCPLSHWNPA